MNEDKYYDLVCSALPDNFDPDILQNYGRPEWWQNNIRLALAYALRRCPLIDWKAYADSCPLVRQSGVEPAWHFLKKGVFEGRKLSARVDITDTAPTADSAMPAISIILYNYNNMLFLSKSLQSILYQTFQNYDIIIIDDASDDNSTKILEAVAKTDKRIKLLRNSARLGLRASRKAGVEAATGQYIMFLDTGDFYYPATCETAYRTVRNGHDMASFDVHFSPFDSGLRSLAPGLAWLNPGKNTHVSGKTAFILASRPENSIIRASVCKMAFSEMDAGASYCQDGIYQALVLCANAEKCVTIGQKLAALNSHRFTSGTFRAQTPLKDIQTFLEKRARDGDYADFENLFTRFQLDALFRLDNKTLFSSHFNALASQCGIMAILRILIEDYNEPLKTALLFRHYSISQSRGKPRVVGILYSILGPGGAERVIIDLSHLLNKHGYEVVLFLETPHPYERELPAGVKRLYIGGPLGGPKKMLDHLLALRESLLQNPVDIMLFHACYASHMLWQLILVRHMGIPAILFPHGAFFVKLMKPSGDLTIQAQTACLRSGDAVPVLSIYEELYYRSQGVNALYLPNPVRLPEEGWQMPEDFKTRKNNIIVFGRLGDPTKNINDCLRVLRELIKHRPRMKMTFVGSFEPAGEQAKFESLARKLGVEKNICLAGWTSDARPYIDSAGALLTCAWHESFALTIAEAQGRGLPVVMYDMPIMPAYKNKSVIRVPHGDIKKAATELLNILGNEQNWLDLSSIARKNARQFSRETYIKNILSLLENYGKCSELRVYEPEDYRVVMRTLGFYGAHMPKMQQY